MITITDIPFYYHYDGILTSQPRYEISADPNDYFQSLQVVQEYIENQLDSDPDLGISKLEYLVEIKGDIQDAIDNDKKLRWFLLHYDPDYKKCKSYIDNIPEPFKTE